jgi:hypothetical protein
VQNNAIVLHGRYPDEDQNDRYYDHQLDERKSGIATSRRAFAL